MKKQEIIDYVKSYPGNQVKFSVADIDGVLRGKSISREKLLDLVDLNIGFCNVIFGWDVNDQVYNDSKVTGWHTGFPDSVATLDLSTFRTIPWNEDIPFLIADFHQSEELSEICPRSLLRKINSESNELGYVPKFSCEYEWFNFQETPDSLNEKGGKLPKPLTPGMFGYSILRSSQYSDFFNDLVELLIQFEVPIEGIHTETGDGVYEACIHYSSAIEAADNGALFKAGVKEIAHKHGIMASFMAKWSDNLPGCGGHLHQSLWNQAEDINLFYDAERDLKMSQLMEHYIAGQLQCLPYILPMYAPTVNSYKRFVSGSWASTSVSWGIRNRTTALRAIPGGAKSTRLETRVPGSDANPYLAISAALASGLYGIKNKLMLNTPETKGNEYDNRLSTPLPSTLSKSVELMKSSDLPAELFGESFVDHFIYTREWEWEQFSGRVTDWELKRYFEII